MSPGIYDTASVSALSVAPRSAAEVEAPSILITHFINPHLFWFKYESDVVVNVNKPLQDLEHELTEHTAALKQRGLYNSGYEAERGEHVAVLHLSWKRWIRVRVDTTIDCLSGGKKYILWATDHGVPLESSSKYMRPLPQSLADRRITSVYRAGIADIIPAELRLNYRSLKTEMVPMDKWSVHAIRTFEDLINNVEIIRFTRTLLLEEPDDENHHHFGHLEFTLASGLLISPSLVLQQLNHALDMSDERFSKDIQMATTRTTPRWLDNNGCLKRFDNVMPPIKINRRMMRPPPGFPDLAVSGADFQCEVNQKISEWNLRNKQATEEDSYDFSDSVSAILPAAEIVPSQMMKRDTPRLTHFRPDDELEENVMKRCATVGLASENQTNATKSKPPIVDVEHALNDIIEATDAVHLNPVVREEVKPVASDKRLTSRTALRPDTMNAVVSKKPLTSRAALRQLILQKTQAQSVVEPPQMTELINQTKEDKLPTLVEIKAAVVTKPEIKEPPMAAIPDATLSAASASPRSITPASSITSSTQKPAAFVHPRTLVIKKSAAPQSAFKQAADQDHCIANSLFLYRVLVHGRHRPKPLEKVGYANFADVVLEVLKEQRFHEIYRIQAYAWPHLMRGNSLVLVNGAGSGKTMSYLPAVCSLIRAKCEDEADAKPAGKGPMGIIVCVSSKKVKQVSNLCRRFMQDAEGCAPQIVEAYGIRNERKTTMLLLQGCSLLVCTAPSLERLITESTVTLFTRSRLQYFVIDDFDMIVNRFSDSLKTVLRRCVHRPAGQTHSSVQLVVTSRMWMPQLRSFFPVGQNTVLVMGAFAEAAVYAQSNVQIERKLTEEKDDRVLEFLRDHHYQEQRTIVICNKNQEVQSLAQRCRQECLISVMCHGDSLDNEITIARSWSSTGETGQYPVLICTDQILPQLNVCTAKNIIHYSIPASWTIYSNRYGSSFEYYEDLVTNDSRSSDPPQSLILLDEHNNVQLPRLIDFMVNHGVESIDPAVLALVKQIAAQTEEQRNRLMVPFCPELMMLGECATVACHLRHVLTESDASRPSIPRHGVVKLAVMKILSPIHFSARLIGHRESGSSEWQTLDADSEYVGFYFQLMSHYSVEENHRSSGAVQLGELCAIAEGKAFHRCRIIDVKKSRMNVIVSVYLIDTGKVMSCRATELLYLEEQFRAFPAQAVQIRIARCVPYDYDTDWESDVQATVKQWLDSDCVGSVYVEGRIELSVLDTLWLDSLRLVERLPGIGQVQVMSVRRNLLDKQFALDDDKAIELMTHMAAAAGIWTPKRVSTVGAVSKIDILEQAAQEKDNKSSDEDSTRTAETPLIQTPTPNEVQPVCQQRGRRHRGAAMTPSVRKSDHRSEHWAELSFDQFESMFITTYFTPHHFYAQAVPDKTKDLCDAIDAYTALETSHAKLLHNTFDGNGQDPPNYLGMLCLARNRDGFDRAKILHMSCTPHEQLVEATIFFVDLGETVTMPFAELLVLPDQLLHIAPFQAILCRLAGLQPTDGRTDWDGTVSDQILDDVLDAADAVNVRPVRKLSSKPNESNSYEVVAFGRVNGSVVNLNKEIVKQKLAAYDAETKHLIDVTFNDNITSYISNEPEIPAEDAHGEQWQDTNYEYKPEASDIDSDTLKQWENMNFELTVDELMEFLRVPPSAKIFEPIATSPDETNLKKLPAIEAAPEALPAEQTDVICDEVISDEIIIERPMTVPSEVAVQRDEPMPKLKFPNKLPNVIWQQNHMVIYLNIHAPDNKGYCLNVTNRMLDFRAKLMDDQIVSCLINFFGCIDTEYTSHEVRGLSVRVRLMKTLRGPQFDWPRLTRHDERCHWIKYNMESIGMDELGDAPLVRPVPMAHSDDNSSSDEGSDVDSEYDL